MSGRGVPRAAVLLLATLIVAGPAAYVLANYRLDGQSRVMHHHTDSYTVYNGVGSGDTTLQTRIDQARTQWNNELQTIKVPSTTGQAASQIDFERAALGQNNAQVVWQSPYHDSHTVATFNIYYSNNMSGGEKQGRACNVMGNIMGLADAPAGRTDCMSAPATYMAPSATSGDLADDFYGPTMGAVDLGGSLIETIGTDYNPSHDVELDRYYSLSATGSGHAMAKVEIFADSQPTPLVTSPTTLACEEKCSRTASIEEATPEQLGLAPGSHTLHFKATNGFGRSVTVDRMINVTYSPPDAASPSFGAAEETATPLLEGPQAVDDETEPTGPEVDLPGEGPDLGVYLRGTASDPNPGLTPIIRAPDDPPSATEPSAGAIAAADSQTPEVNVGVIRWSVLQPTATRHYYFDKLPGIADEQAAIARAPDAVLRSYLDAGVQIRSIKIVDAPKWASDSRCVWQARDGVVKQCAPLPGKDPALTAFATAVAARYGPGTTYGIEHFAFWNEANLGENWGPSGDGRNGEDRAKDYSRRLTAFAAGVRAGKVEGASAMKVDAGEIAAGGSLAKGNGPRQWAVNFTDFNHENHADAQNPYGQDRNYDELTIHAYSQDPSQVPRKAYNYRILPGVGPVGITEFGWAQRDSAETGNWKRVNSAEAQADNFSATVRNFHRERAPLIESLSWFNLIDAHKSTRPPCPDPGYYTGTWTDATGDQPAADRTNTYGLYRRWTNGSLKDPADHNGIFDPNSRARTELRTAFQCAADPTCP